MVENRQIKKCDLILIDSPLNFNKLFEVAYLQPIFNFKEDNVSTMQTSSLRSLGRQLAREMESDEVRSVSGGENCGTCCVDRQAVFQASPNCGPDPCGDDPGY